MDRGLITLNELHAARANTEPWLVDLVQPEIGGGRLHQTDLSRIESHTGAHALRVSGLDQTTFEELVLCYGDRFTAIHFWKCPGIRDLSPLQSLPHLRLISFFWNQRAEHLWDLAATPNLTGLRLYDFTRLHDLTDISRGSSLRELEFGDAVWDSMVIETLDPIAHLHALRSLKISAKKINDDRIEPLAHLQQLASLDFSSKQFTTRQVAWLRAHLPDTLQSEALEPLRRFSKPFSYNGKDRDVLLVGKRKPFLSSTADASRIEKHIADFERMVAEFRRDPSLPPT